MPKKFTQTELEAFLDEALPPEAMAAVEAAARGKPEVVRQLSAINARRDSGVHSVGEIWRRGRLSCPTREQLGSFLLKVLPEGHADYVKFHLEVVGCRFCLANAADLRASQAEAAEKTRSRRRKYFQSSAGYLRGDG